MADADPQFLLVRPDDLVVLGVRWFGFHQVQAGGPGGPPVLQADGGGGRVVLTFPPQAVAEEGLPPESVGVPVRRAFLAGPSRVEFTVPPGTRMPVDAAGLLAALTGGARLASGGPGDERTAIELPWRLFVSVLAANAAAGVAVELPGQPPAARATGLWHARLHAADTAPGTPGAGLALLPLRTRLGPSDVDIAPLDAGERQAIVSEGAVTRPVVSRLELSALGGTLSARLMRPTFQWDHDVSLGRDQRVRVLTKGVLYPFGHHAEFEKRTERQFEPAVGPAVAGLRTRQILVVTEPVRLAVGNPREFPFAEVEVLARTFTDLGPPQWALCHREPLPQGDLQDELASLVTREQDLTTLVNTALANLPTDVQGMIDQELLSGPALAEAQANASDRNAELADLRQRREDTDRAIDLLERDLDHAQTPEEATAIQQQISELIAGEPTNQEIQAAIVAANQAKAIADQLRNRVQAEVDNLPRDVDALSRRPELSGGAEAAQLLDVRAAIADRRRRLAAIAAAAAEDHNLFFIPSGSDGRPIRFPLRLAGALGDVYVDVPLVFVRDFTFDADPNFPAFASLTDPDTLRRLGEAWAPNADIPLPGVPVDLVRGAPLLVPGPEGPPLNGDRLDIPSLDMPDVGDIPEVREVPAVPGRLPGDVHEVHRLAVAAAQHADGFRPLLREVDVELPAVRALLPDQARRVAVRYAQDFLDRGEAAVAPLRLVAPLVLDFTARADRSGGLVAPKYAADAISRGFGPVPLAALPGAGGVPDLASIYNGATLLGFPLGSLIETAGPHGLPFPPAITPILENGRPAGVRMDWTGVRLKNFGPLRTAGSTLSLAVTASPASTETKCTVDAVALVLPAAAPLITVSFRSLEFTQLAGKPPTLAIGHIGVDFSGGLRLLSKLQEKLMELLGISKGPAVHASQTGITASYALSLPSVAAGAFLLRDIALRIAVDVPFERRPVTVGLAFASRDNPFHLSVLMFGGGGYIDLQFGAGGLSRLEASLDFGAMVAVDFVVARGEVHALGGVRLREQPGGGIDVEGFIRIGGSVEVLGLVSVSIELVVALRYESAGNRLVGRATIVVEVDLTFFSESVHIDSGEWVLVGSDQAPPPRHALPADQPVFLADEEEEDPGLVAWRAYREAFA
jgi:hypothetical protein